MQENTKKRRFKFVLVSTITAAVFCLVLFVSVAKKLETSTAILSALSAIASGFSAWCAWTLIMGKRETKFRGAWAGITAVLLAYPIMALLMAIFDKSALGATEYFLTTLVLGLTMTGIFTVPLGGFLGHWIARNQARDAQE